MRKFISVIVSLIFFLSGSAALAQTDVTTGGATNVGSEVSGVSQETEKQIMTLRREMEGRIKAIKTEYEGKIQALRKTVQTKKQGIREGAKTMKREVKQNVNQGAQGLTPKKGTISTLKAKAPQGLKAKTGKPLTKPRTRSDTAQ